MEKELLDLVDSCDLAEVEKRVDLERTLRMMFEFLSEQELRVIELRFGCDGTKMARREVAETLGITIDEARRYEQRGMRKLWSSAKYGWIGQTLKAYLRASYISSNLIDSHRSKFVK